MLEILRRRREPCSKFPAEWIARRGEADLAGVEAREEIKLVEIARLSAARDAEPQGLRKLVA